MEDDQQFCLRWNNHQSTLIQNFDTLLESGTLVDCTLAAEGKYLKAHKVVLSACSPYFEGLLSEHYDKHPVFILKDVKFKELKAMMEYMYRGEVNISQEQLTALLKAAESLQIKGLSDNRTGGSTTTSGTTTGKSDAKSAKTGSAAASTVAATASSVDIPHASSGLTIEKNKVPRQSLQQISVSDLQEGSASPQLRGLSSREGSQSPTRKRRRARRRSLGNEDTNASIENHEASNSSDFNISAPALGVAPVADEKSHADSADPIGRSALMQQLTKPADEMIQLPIEKPEPSEAMLEPKSEYLDDQESVEDLTNLDDDMNDQNELEQDNSRAGPSHDPSQHAGLASWHMAGDRSNTSIVGAATGPPGGGDEAFLQAQEAAQAQRDSQVSDDESTSTIEQTYDEHASNGHFMDTARPTLVASKYECVQCHSTYTTLPRLKNHKRVCPRSKNIMVDAVRRSARAKRVDYRKKANVRNYRARSDENNLTNTVLGTRVARARMRGRPRKPNPWARNQIEEKFNDKKAKKKNTEPVEYYGKLKEGHVECDNCKIRFASKEPLILHLRKCAKLYNFFCPYCDYKEPEFNTSMLRHLKTYHKNKDMYCKAEYENTYNCMNANGWRRWSANRKKYACTWCPSRFLNKYRLRRHMKYECRKVYVCPWCKKYFADHRAARNHILQFHDY